MTKEQVLESNALKKRFVRDCNLPINLFAEPYFTQRIKELDFLFGCEAECFVKSWKHTRRQTNT